MPDQKITLTLIVNSVLTGLDRLGAAYAERMRQVEDFNKRIENGGAALNQVLTQAAAFAGVHALHQYTEEAIHARQSQAQLESALRSTSQFTPQLMAQLVALGQSLQSSTGKSKEDIFTIIRQLVQDEVPQREIPRLTGLIMDMATAMGMDLPSAAALFGRALAADDPTLARFHFNIDRSLPKIDQLTQLMTQLEQRFGGQTQAAVNAMGRELADFAVESKEAKEEVGQLTLEIVSPFLKGFTQGLKDLREWLRNVREESGGLIGFLKSEAGSSGEVFGKLFAWIAPVAAVILILKGGLTLLLPLINLVRSGFVLLTGTNLIQFLANVATGLRLVSAEGVAAAGAMTLLESVAAFAVVGAAIAGTLFLIGKDIQAWRELNKAQADAAQSALDYAASRQKIQEAFARFANVQPQPVADIKGVEEAKTASHNMMGALTLITTQIDQLQEKRKQTVDLIRASASFDLEQGPVTVDAESDPEVKSIDAKIIALQKRAEALRTSRNEIRKTFIDTPAASAAAVTPQTPFTMEQRQKIAETEIAITKSQIATEELVLEQGYANRQVSLADYLKQKSELIDRSFRDEINETVRRQTQLQADLDARDESGKNKIKHGSDEEAAVLTQKKEVDAKFVQLAQQRNQKLLELQQRGVDEQRRVTHDSTDIEIKLDEARNLAVIAAEKKFEDEYGELRKRFIAEGDTKALAALNDLKGLQLSAAGLEQIKKFTDTIDAGLQGNLQNIDVRVNVGSLSKREGLTETLEARKKSAADYQLAIDKIFSQAQGRSFTTDEIKNVNELNTKILQLKPSLEDVAATSDKWTVGFSLGLKKFQDGLGSLAENIANTFDTVMNSVNSGFSQSINDMLLGTANLKQNWLDVGRAAVVAITTMVAQYIAGKFAMMAAEMVTGSAIIAKNTAVAISGAAAGAGVAASQSGWGVIAYVAAYAAVMAAIMGIVGAVLGAAEGEIIEDGTGPMSDDVLRKVSRGEAIIPADEVAKRRGFFQKIIDGNAQPADFVATAGQKASPFTRGAAGAAKGEIVEDGTGPTSDDVVRRVSKNEAIIPAARVLQFGRDFFQKIIDGKARAEDFIAATGEKLAGFASGFVSPDMAALPQLAPAGLTPPIVTTKNFSATPAGVDTNAIADAVRTGMRQVKLEIYQKLHIGNEDLEEIQRHPVSRKVRDEEATQRRYKTAREVHASGEPS